MLSHLGTYENAHVHARRRPEDVRLDAALQRDFFQKELLGKQRKFKFTATNENENRWKKPQFTCSWSYLYGWPSQSWNHFGNRNIIITGSQVPKIQKKPRLDPSYTSPLINVVFVYSGVVQDCNQYNRSRFLFLPWHLFLSVDSVIFFKRIGKNVYTKLYLSPTPIPHISQFSCVSVATNLPSHLVIGAGLQVTRFPESTAR